MKECMKQINDFATCVDFDLQYKLASEATPNNINLFQATRLGKKGGSSGVTPVRHPLTHLVNTPRGSVYSCTSKECKDLGCTETSGFCNCADGWSTNIVK